MTERQVAGQEPRTDAIDRPQPLTQREIDAVRALLKQNDRQIWLWKTVRTWTSWFMGCIAGAAVLIELFKRLIEHLLRP